MLQGIHTSVGQAVGTHVLLLVVERSLWLTRHKHQEAARVTYSEAGVSLNGLSDLDQELAVRIAHDLVMTIVSTLGRLIGKQLAERIVEQLDDNHREA